MINNKTIFVFSRDIISSEIFVFLSFLKDNESLQTDNYNIPGSLPQTKDLVKLKQSLKTLMVRIQKLIILINYYLIMTICTHLIFYQN